MILYDNVLTLKFKIVSWLNSSVHIDIIKTIIFHVFKILWSCRRHWRRGGRLRSAAAPPLLTQKESSWSSPSCLGRGGGTRCVGRLVAAWRGAAWTPGWGRSPGRTLSWGRGRASWAGGTRRCSAGCGAWPWCMPSWRPSYSARWGDTRNDTASLLVKIFIF